MVDVISLLNWREAVRVPQTPGAFHNGIGWFCEFLINGNNYFLCSFNPLHLIMTYAIINMKAIFL